VRGQRRVAWKNAPNLASKKDAQEFHNAGRLQGIIAQGAEHTTLRAGLGNLQPNGVVRRGSSIPQTIRRQVPPEADNCGGLEQEIKMAVEDRLMLRRNIGTEDGLVNGVMGTVVGFEWPEGVAVDDPERQPTAIKVLFDNKRVGQKARQFARERDGIVDGDLPHSPVFITSAISKFLDRTKRHHLERYQFPLELAWAMTIHRVQGLSMDRAVIDLGSDIIAHGQAYVAFSSVRTLAGVLQCNFNVACLRLTESKVLSEYRRLLGLV
jgi:ATP-dependent exoDNAse (exonuclease V) alpha subunit